MSREHILWRLLAYLILGILKIITIILIKLRLIVIGIRLRLIPFSKKIILIKILNVIDLFVLRWLLHFR